MKKQFLILSLITLFFASCGSDDTQDIVINIDGSGGNNNNGAQRISGTYTTDLTLQANKEYLLNGSLIMAAGTTLTIQQGVTVKALAAGSDVYIAISQGAKIDAQGTSSSPIVFTSNASTPKAGDWGGLIILGKAPINSVSGGTATSTSEIASLPYGGNIANDNSGTLKYVRVEYSGGSADGQSENNGFSFYGVGNGTTVEYIQMFEGKDDGIEFFGGTVNVSYVSVVNAQDDSIDWTEGYTGTIKDAYVKHGADHDKGIEADGYNTDIGNNSNPIFFSKPTVTNLTIIGLGSNSDNEAVRLRAGTQGIFDNILIKGFKEGFDIDGNNTANPTATGVLSDDLQATNVKLDDVTTKVKKESGVSYTDADFLTENANATGTEYATWGANWTRQ
ncbi:multidrug transporter [Tenacibaculum holothuriorum]|uniref:Multidrug transporter n=1 Tax=Tenacibaculum holothuriorum TaxID=1635173 RepID=A0A1Y2PE61_9FLAO|nr:multidrug transporter [Tenacibaculum holothuriorum]OSY88725.1 multidrug transporter [Tenacibaculum holothuriorum]